jgi:hypothetical protein
MNKLFITLTLLVDLSLEDPVETLDSLEEKLLSIPTEDGEDTEEEPSLEKILPKLIDLLLTLPDGSLNLL